MSDLDALIAKLEGAPRGSRGLDVEIALALGHNEPRVRGSGILNNGGPIPLWTTSLDDAMTLVPERCWPWLSVYDHGRFGAHVKLYGPRHQYASDCILHGAACLKPVNTAGYHNATNLWPLALCIAALKARRAANE